MEICTSFSRLSKGIESPEEWSSLFYTFHSHRCGILLKILDGKCQLIPFVNTSYDNRNAWRLNDDLRFTRGSLDSHYEEKTKTFGFDERKDRGFLKYQTQWWLNGYTLCNVVPSNLWSLRGLKEIEEMIQASLKYLKGVACNLVINKRDSPIMRRKFMQPFPFEEKLMHPCFVRPTQSPLSFYVGPNWEDVPFPVPESWEWSNGRGHCGEIFTNCFQSHGILLRTVYNEKYSKAVFRGTATGAGIDFANQRLLLVKSVQHNEFVDAGITAWNQRDRITVEGINFQSPIGTLVPKMLPQTQCKHKILIYVDGHQASSRLVWHLASGCTTIIIDSGPLTLAPFMWIHAHLIENVHYVRAKSDCSNICEIVQDLLSNQEKAFKIAAAAFELANRILTPESLAAATANSIISSRVHLPERYHA